MKAMCSEVQLACAERHTCWDAVQKDASQPRVPDILMDTEDTRNHLDCERKGISVSRSLSTVFSLVKRWMQTGNPWRFLIAPNVVPLSQK
jgi:hypothetical protein